MRVDRREVERLRQDITPLIHGMTGPESRSLVANDPVNASLMVATAYQVVRQLAEESRMSMEAVAAALQVNARIAAMNFENIEGFLQSFPEAAAGESEFVRLHVMNGLRGYFAEELLSDDGCRNFLRRVAEHAVTESQRIIDQEGRTGVAVRNEPRAPVMSPALAEGCLRGIANVIEQANVGGLERGLKMLLQGSASFGSPLAGIEQYVREVFPQASGQELAVQTQRAADYLSRFSHDLGQGIIVDMGQAWLREHEAALIAAGRALEMERGVLDVEDRLVEHTPLMLVNDADGGYADENVQESTFIGLDDFSMDR